MYLGYVRVSSVGAREDTLVSPDLQAERIRAFASQRGIEVELLDPELDVSGGAVNRPILGQAIERIEAGAQGLIVAQLDRLSRMSLVDALKVIRRIEDAGGEVLSAGEPFDTSTPEGRLGRNVFLSFGEMQLERYKAQFAEAKERAVARGIWPTTAPRGYRKGADRRLVPDRSARRVIRAFELRAAGKSWREVADYLGCGASGAAKIVRNRAYLGELRLGEMVNLAAHPPIIGRDLFEAAQLSHPRPPRGKHGPALLAGIIRCANCRYLLTRDERLYRCFPRKAGFRCSRPAIVGRWVEGYVEEVVLAHAGEVRFEAHQRTQELKEAAAALAAAEAELDDYQLATRATGLAPENFARGLGARVEDVEEARLALANARTLPSDFVSSLQRFWPNLSVEERRHVLRRGLGAVWVWKGRPATVRLMAPGSTGPVRVPVNHFEGEIAPPKNLIKTPQKSDP